MLSSDSLNRLASATGSLAEKKAGSSQPVVDPLMQFALDFDQYKAIVIDPVVDQANQMLEPSGSVLDVVISNPERKTFFAAQIFLHDFGKALDPLNDPYLVIEGYPGVGKVRLAEGHSSNAGDTFPISDIDQNASQHQERILNNLSALIEKQL